MATDQAIYRSGDCELDTANRRFRRGGREYALEPKVFAVLLQLIGRAGELVTRDELLDGVWGHRYVTPSTLNRVIGLARRALGDDAEAPRFIQTVHGAGYRYLGPAHKVSAGEPRARFAPPLVARLPARLQSLIGRDAELGEMAGLLGAGRALTLVGSGGIGKTQCALAFAHAQAPQFSDGVWFFDLVPMRGADEVLQALALALSIAPSAARELGNIAAGLAGRQALLFLDNCDRLCGELGPLLFELLRATEQMKVLATSQQQLNFLGERVLRLPPLRVPQLAEPDAQPPLAEIRAAPAVSLLVTRVKEVQPQFGLSVANAGVIAEICRRLDGMPLALELAAPRFALLSPEQVLERLDQRFRFLIGSVAGRDPRHQNLVALLEWSFALLSADEQRLLAWLGVFVQGFSVEAAIDMAQAFGASPEGLVDLLSGLTNKSLVSVDHGVNPPRYRLLESVREFALQQLRLRGEEHAAREAHLGYILRMTAAANADMLSGHMRERIRALTQEQGNIDSAAAYAMDSAAGRTAALRIAGQLALYFRAHGATAIGKRLCDQVLAGSSARSRERAQALLGRGMLDLYGDKQETGESLRDAMLLAQELGDQRTVAYASGYLALRLVQADRAAEAAEQVATTTRLAAQLDDANLRSLAGLAQGWLQLDRGDLDNALRTMRAHRKLGGDYHQHHFVSMYVGLALFRQAAYAEAAAEWHEALLNAIAVGNRRGMAGSVEGCAYLAQRFGDPRQACRLLAAAEQTRRHMRSPLFRFWLAHHEQAHAALRAILGPAEYQLALERGALQREEDVVNEAAVQLRRFAAADPASYMASSAAGS